MAQAEINEVLPVEKDRLFKVITNYDDYPEFVDGCTSVKVEKKSGGKTRVTYSLNMIKDITYTLEHTEDPKKGTVSWKLVESDFLKKNNGSWELKDKGDGSTEVNYSLEVEFKFPVPGMILNRLVKGSLPTMLKNFEKRAKSHG